MEAFDELYAMSSADAAAEAAVTAVAAAKAAAAKAADLSEAQTDMFPAKLSLAMAYVPYQSFDGLYDGGDALAHGTLFRALDLPFYGAKKEKN